MEEGREEEMRVVLLSSGVDLAALLRLAVHVFGDVIHIHDVRPLLWVGVNTHIYHLPQLDGERKERERDVDRKQREEDIDISY